MSYSLAVQILSNSPLVKWADGVLELELDDGGQAKGELRLDNFEEPFPLTGTVSYKVMNGAFVQLTGKNSKASIEPTIVFMEDDFIAVAYVGGILNVLEYEMQEWLPYVLQGNQKVSD